jgi:hypothetical protein
VSGPRLVDGNDRGGIAFSLISVMVNAVVFFAIGQGAIEAYLTAFKTADFDPLPIVASSFVSRVAVHYQVVTRIRQLC